MFKNLSRGIGLSLLLASSIASAQSKESDEAMLVQAHKEWTQAVNTGHYDSPKASGMWSPDLRGWAPGAPEDSYEREAKGLRYYMEKYPRSASSRPTFEFEILETMISGDLAFVHVLWTQTDASGAKQPTMRSFEVWRKHGDGSWKMSRYLESPKN